MLNKDNIITDIRASDWKEVVTLAGDMLVKSGNIHKNYINSMIETVHKLGPYMILLPKVAFFHGPPSDDVIKPGLSLVVLKDTVKFTEFDNEEINCAFAFCAIDNESHLTMLQDFTKLLSNEKLINQITSNASKEAIIKTLEEIYNDV